MATQAGSGAAATVETPKYAIGTKVRKFFEGCGWFSGKVVSYDGSYYNVLYDDGDEEEYNEEDLAQIILTSELEQVTIGSRVAVYRSSDDQYYEATVARERIDRKPLYLEFDNGEHQWVDLREEQFILLEERARRRIRLQAPMKKTARREEASAVSSSNDLTGIGIGSRIAVYRSSTDQYYEATVTEEPDGDNRFYCKYTSGGGEWIDLRQRDFLPLEGQAGNNSILQDTKEVKQEKPRAKSLPPKQEEDEAKVSQKKDDNADAKDTPSMQQEQSESLSDLDKIDIGSRVAIYRSSDDQYYEAVVTRKRFIKKPFFLEYTNGDREWVDFRFRKFVLLKEEQDMPGRRSTRSGENKRKDVSVASTSNNEVSEGKSPKGNKRRRIATTNTGKSKAVGKGKGKPKPKSCNNSFNTSHNSTTGNAPEAKGKPKDAVGTKTKGKPGTKVKVTQKYDIGTKVKKFFRGSGWFYGEVLSFNGWYYRILYSDGDKEDCDEQALDDIVVSPELEKVQVGLRVAVHWPSDDKFYEATIVREHMDSKKPYYLEYDTGHYEWVDLGKIKFCILGGGTRRRSNTIAEDECYDTDVYVDEAGEDSDNDA